MPPTCLIRGVGDVGSAIAHSLFGAGYPVVLHDFPAPATPRRGMAFADAIFDGACLLEGVTARHVADPGDLPTVLAGRAFVPVVTWGYPMTLTLVRPAVLVDAQMRKRARPSVELGTASLTIGLGPNFTAGVTTDVVIETSWEDLGRIITEGAALPLQGEPQMLAGHARDRCVYASVAGVFRTPLDIGASVSAGQWVASVGDTRLLAPLSGVLRGLTRDGVPVVEGAKVIEVDPRGPQAMVRGIGERPRVIAASVLRVVRDRERGSRALGAAS